MTHTTMKQQMQMSSSTRISSNRRGMCRTMVKAWISSRHRITQTHKEDSTKMLKCGISSSRCKHILSKILDCNIKTIYLNTSNNHINSKCHMFLPNSLTHSNNLNMTRLSILLKCSSSMVKILGAINSSNILSIKTSNNSHHSNSSSSNLWLKLLSTIRATNLDLKEEEVECHSNKFSLNISNINSNLNTKIKHSMEEASLLMACRLNRLCRRVSNRFK